MNVFDVKITRQAEKQIREIAWYITVELHNPEAAETLMDEFDKEFAALGKNPERHPVVDDEPWKSDKVRWKKVKNFMVFFWVDIEHAAVQITGVMYKAHDHKRFLSEMEMTD